VVSPVGDCGVVATAAVWMDGYCGDMRLMVIQVGHSMVVC
jgi:hypothetical protein